MAMGLLIGGLATAVIERVVSMASTHLEDYFKRRKGKEEKLQRLKMLLPQIQSVVDAAERGEQQIPDPLNKWLWQLKVALYEANDVLDELDYLQLKQQAEADANKKEQHKVRELMSRSKSRAIKFAKHIFRPDPTLNKLRRAVKKLSEAAADAGNFVALVSNAQREFQQQETQTILKRETGPLLTENKVLGREKEKDELLRWLTMMPADHEDESKMNVSLFSLVGHGGMGKTTLAQLVYNDEMVQESFHLKIWVCVSTSFDVRGLTRSILESATKQRPDVDGLPALQDVLKEKLRTSGKFLLILDDVWNDDDGSNWDKLLAPLKHGRKGSKILLTTRMDRVADMAARAMGAPTKGSLKLAGLHGDDFSSLFDRYAFAGVNYGNYPNLQRIGKQIAKRLGGSPLAAKTVGGLLNFNLDDGYWIEILDSKNISDQVQNGEDDIMSILMLSYHHLPLHLRPCFAYCGMFPKDHEFLKEDLVLMWMAVGLIQQSHQNQDLGYGDVTMPDAFSHLIHLRSLNIDRHDLRQFPRSLCKLYHLQVLKFSYGKGAIKLPESMNKLVNLRHLSASNQVAGVGKLTFLQELDFSVKKERGYEIGELGDLIWLHTLSVGGLENVENQEAASMAKLCNKKYLKTLHLGWSASSDPGMDTHELVLDHLEPHANLKKLTIGGYRGIRYANWRLPFLEELELKNMPAIKKLDYQCQHLKKLIIYDMERLEELSGLGADAGQWHPHLQTLEIRHCPKLEVGPSLSLSIREICLDNLGLGSLPTLWLDRSSTCSTSGSLSSSPSSLQVLEIRNCGKITSLSKGLLQLQHYLTVLERLEIWDCPELVDFPSGGLQYLRALKYLRIEKCPKLQVAQDPITPDGNDDKCLPLSLRSLSIIGCAELVRSMPTLLKGIVSLGELSLRDSEELMSLEGLIGLQSVGHLWIDGCPKLGNAAGSDFTIAVDMLDIDDPILLALGVLRSLTSVRKLRIWDCGQLESIDGQVEQWFLQNKNTLQYLYISGASETLKERCRKDEGADWPTICHIPNLLISNSGRLEQ